MALVFPPELLLAKFPLIKDNFSLPAEEKIEAADIPHEIQRFKEALKFAENDVRATEANITKSLGKKYGEIFAIHLLLLKDKILGGKKQ